MRKIFLICLFVILVTPVMVKSQANKVDVRPEVPFKVIFNNDCTNIGSCISPFNPDYKKSRPECVEEMLIASVDEAADSGVEAFCFSPGMGWTPWWPSPTSIISPP